jgi:hypothetical protein
MKKYFGPGRALTGIGFMRNTELYVRWRNVGLLYYYILTHYYLLTQNQTRSNRTKPNPTLALPDRWKQPLFLSHKFISTSGFRNGVTYLIWGDWSYFVVRSIKVSESGGDSTETSVGDFANLIMWYIEDFQLGIFKQCVGQKSQPIMWNVDNAKSRRTAQHILIYFTNIIVVKQKYLETLCISKGIWINLKPKIFTIKFMLALSTVIFFVPVEYCCLIYPAKVNAACHYIPT